MRRKMDATGTHYIERIKSTLRKDKYHMSSLHLWVLGFIQMHKISYGQIDMREAKLSGGTKGKCGGGEEKGDEE